MLWPMVVYVAGALAAAEGHGRVEQPPSRASAWRAGFLTQPDYDDDGVNCGGMTRQWNFNRGRCGICGDRYDVPSPRPHELGGKYGEGVIVAHYQPSEVFTISVRLTTSHAGFWEFKLCPNPDTNEQDCFDHYPLELADGGTRYYPKKGSIRYDVQYRLPQGLVCEHCVLQWRYTAGNNWGVCSNGTQGLGCGNQETFGACSDISIGAPGDNSVPQKDLKQLPLPYHLKRGYYDVGQVDNSLSKRNKVQEKHKSFKMKSRRETKLKNRRNKYIKIIKPYKQKTVNWRS